MSKGLGEGISEVREYECRAGWGVGWGHGCPYLAPHFSLYEQISGPGILVSRTQDSESQIANFEF